MADKRIFQLEEEGFLDDITDKVYMWLDKKANEGELQEPSWKFKANVFLKILNNFATKFVPNVATVEGKCYWYGGDLYECNTAYSGAWVPANFTATSIDELFARKDVLSELQTDVGNLQDALGTTNGNVTSLTTYAQNVAHSIAPEFEERDEQHPYPVGAYVMRQGKFYRFKNQHYGAWSSSDVTETSAGGSLAQCPRMMGSAEYVNAANANDAPVGSFFWCQGGTSYTNYPISSGTSAYSGVLFTYGRYYDSPSQYVAQLYVTTDPYIFYRFKRYGGYWTGWKRCSDSDEVDAVISSLSNISASIAPEFDPTRASDNPYPVGAYVMYRGKLYRFKNSHYGAWSSSDVTETSAGKSFAQCPRMMGTAEYVNATDANNAPVGSIVWCQGDSSYANLPTSPGGGFYAGNLFTYGRYYDSPSQYVTQLYVTTNPYIFYRFKRYGGSWTEWKRCLNTDDLTPFNEITLALNYPDLSMFKRVGVIGDSYASAYLCDANGDYVGTFYDISWPQILCRKTGCTWINFTRGGLSTRSWLTNADYGLPKLLTEDPCDLYVLVLGINDHAIDDYMGSIADITSYESYEDYPDTFYGNYGKIFEQIKAYAPAAKIVFSTMANNALPSQSGTFGAYNLAIEEIAEHYEVPCIKQYEDPFFSQPIYNGMYGSHPTKAGQAGMATAIERLLQKCIVNNLIYFNSFEGST